MSSCLSNRSATVQLSKRYNFRHVIPQWCNFVDVINPSNQPGSHDVVLSDRVAAPIGGVVLGGCEGLQQRFVSPLVEQRLAAVCQAKNYGEAGLDLLIRALQDPALSVQKAAYWNLHNRTEPIVHQALQTYEVYQLFECLGTFKGHQRGITAVALSPDQKTIISAGRDHVLRVWDIEFQEEVMAFSEYEFVYGIAISPDNRRFTIKTGERRFKAWDMRTGQQIDAEELPTRGIASVTVSKTARKAIHETTGSNPKRQNTGKYLISGSQNLIRVWNLAKGREVSVLRGHTSLVTAVAATPHRSLIVSGGEDNMVKLWGISQS